MKITITQLNEDPAVDWAALTAHVHAAGSDLVLLPEMAFSPWSYVRRQFEPATWAAAVAAHEIWLSRLGELAPARVAGSRPVDTPAGRRNEAFVWDPAGGYQAAHHKYYLPDEEMFWEARWYGRGDGRFRPVAAGPARAGFMICTDLWFLQHARAYGQAGVQILLNPRATEFVTVDKWLAGGRAAAVVSGAYCFSSNRVNDGGGAVHLGGQGWAVDPDGAVLALTSAAQPFVTVTVDLALADAAKQSYPRYVQD